MLRILVLSALLASPALGADVWVPPDPSGYDGPRVLELKYAWMPFAVTLARDLHAGDCVDVPFVARATRACWQDFPALGCTRATAIVPVPPPVCARKVMP